MTGTDDSPDDCVRRDALDVTYEEARRVVEYQLNSVSDIDTKAAHTLRVLFVLFGLLITASSMLINSVFQQAGPDVETAKQFINTFTVGGVVLLLSSLFVAIWTYNETHTRSGPSPPVIDYLSHDAPRKQRFGRLLSQFPEWMIHNEIAIRRDSTLLFASHFAMFLGIIALITGVVTELPFDVSTYAVRTPVPIGYWLLMTGVFTVGLGVLDAFSPSLHRLLVGFDVYTSRDFILVVAGMTLVLVGVGLVLL